MNPARILVFAVAIAAGGVAAYLAATSDPPASPAQVVQTTRATEVLVAAVDIPVGAPATAKELRWQSWPSDGTTNGMITRTARPQAVQEFTGAIARTTLLQGEPIRTERLAKIDQGGVMSALLPPGQRALAIAIDNRGTNSAGNFILPNDRVDVIRVYKDDASSSAETRDVFATQTLLRNVRVLAIGQNIQERNGEKIVVGETATLELDPRQVELVLLAQKVGQLSLALRSLQDISKVDGPIEKGNDNSLTICATAPRRSVEANVAASGESEMKTTAKLLQMLPACSARAGSDAGARPAEAGLRAGLTLAFAILLACGWPRRCPRWRSIRAGSADHRRGGPVPPRGDGDRESLIVDLPRDAKEVFVANPKVANAIVRSTRKIS